MFTCNVIASVNINFIIEYFHLAGTANTVKMQNRAILITDIFNRHKKAVSLCSI